MCRFTLLVVLVSALGAVSAYPTDGGYRVKRSGHDGYHSPSDHCEDNHQHVHKPHGAHGHDSSNWDDSDEDENKEIEQKSEQIDISQIEQSEEDFSQKFDQAPFKSITEDAKLLVSSSVSTDTQNPTPQVGQSGVNVGQNAQSELTVRQTGTSESTNSQAAKLQVAFNENEQSGVNIGIKVPAELADDQSGSADSTSNYKKTVQFADDDFTISQNERKHRAHNPSHVDQGNVYNNNHGKEHHHGHHDYGKDNYEHERSHEESHHAHGEQPKSPCAETELPPKKDNRDEIVKSDDVVVPKVDVVQPIPADLVGQQETLVPAIPQDTNAGSDTSQMKKSEHNIHEYPFDVNKGSYYYNHDHVKENDKTEIPPIVDITKGNSDAVNGDNVVVSKVDGQQPIPTDAVVEQEVPMPAVPRDKTIESDTSQTKEHDIYQKPFNPDDDIDYKDYPEHHEHPEHHDHHESHEHHGHHDYQEHHDGPSVEYHL